MANKKLKAEYIDEESRAFAVEIDAIFEELRGLLMEKNRKYGNSALNPIRIFSLAETTEQIRVRIDDKLSRLRRGFADDEDTVLDLMGYLVLLRVAQKDVKEDGPF